MVGPAVGRLACGTEGPGRMAEPPEIIQAIEQLFIH
jgi:phosphopantothenoylcysteine synthetase/decarboxylase